VIPHVTDEIKARIEEAAQGVDILLCEVGGTVGDIESLPFLEAIRQFRAQVGRENVCYIHIALVPFVATAGDLIRMPMNVPHGLFNKSDQPIKCLFWVTPTRKLYDLFWAIHSMKEQNPPDVVALSARHEVNFLPPPPGA